MAGHETQALADCQAIGRGLESKATVLVGGAGESAVEESTSPDLLASAPPSRSVVEAQPAAHVGTLAEAAR